MLLRMYISGAASALVLIAACGDIQHPAWLGATQGSNAVDAGLMDSFRGDAVASDPNSVDGSSPATELCEGLTLAGPPVDEYDAPWAPPDMLGGVLELGTYDLSQLLSFGSTETAAVESGSLQNDPLPGSGGGPASDGGTSPSTLATSARTAQAILVVEEYALRRLTQWSGEPARAEAFLYATEGATLSLRSVCPTRDSEVTYGYSVVGDTLALLLDPQHLEIYSKR